MNISQPINPTAQRLIRDLKHFHIATVEQGFSQVTDVAGLANWLQVKGKAMDGCFDFSSAALIEQFIKQKRAVQVIDPGGIGHYFDEPASKLRDAGIRTIVFHAGTPKTGSSGFQSTIVGQQKSLVAQGITYPSWIKSQAEPKHQKLVTAMKKNDHAGVQAFWLQAIEEARVNQSHTLLISTEGIHNHWFDFSTEMKSWLVNLASVARTEFWVVLREPVGFLHSLYIQNLINPAVHSPACFGRDLSFVQMMNDPWFIRHLDYAGFMAECESLAGPGCVVPIRYSRSVVLDLCTRLGITVTPEEVVHNNATRNRIPSTVLRSVNRQNLNGQEKRRLLAEMKRSEVFQPEVIGAGDRLLIGLLFEPQRLFINRRFGLAI